MSEPTKPLPHVLVVDDDLALAETIADGLLEHHFATTAVGSSREASAQLDRISFDAVVTDLRMPEIDGLGVLALSQKRAPDRPVIVMTAYSAVDSAIESIRRGAYHYLTKPFKVDELALFLGRALDDASVRREAQSLRRTLLQGSTLANVIGRGAALRETCTLVTRVADADVPVLLLGETGTGKGLFARALHAESTRARRAFVSLNCAALPEQLLESELFGHVRGAFTGAASDRRGLFEEADGGTLFLDEIGEMALPLQAKLLHVLESGTVRAVGSDRERKTDVRIVAATHRDLRERVKSGQFREDLLFRLDVVTIEVPPLRHRTDDMPELLAHFLAQALRRHPRATATGFTRAATERLLAHPWPGNVRELENVVERAVLLGTGSDIDVADLPASVSQAPLVDPASSPFRGPVVSLAEMQRRYASWALLELGGRKMLTAETLDVDRKTLAKLLGGGS